MEIYGETLSSYFLMSKKDQQALLSDSCCPPEVWWELAILYPITAMSTLRFIFVMKNNADRWQKLELENCGRWTKEAFFQLNVKQQYSFLADCAERVLPLFEQQYPYDERPRNVIQSWRLKSESRITKQQVFNCQNKAIVSSSLIVEDISKLDISVKNSIMSIRQFDVIDFSTASKITREVIGIYKAKAALMAAKSTQWNSFEFAIQAVGFLSICQQYDLLSIGNMEWNSRISVYNLCIDILSISDNFKCIERKWQWFNILKYIIE